MLTTKERIKWLKSQISEIKEFISYERQRLAIDPNNRSAIVSLQCWEVLREGYARDLALLQTEDD